MSSVMSTAYAAVQDHVAIANRSDWGRVRISDADRVRFLHNQTTNDFQSLAAGQGCDTVFVTSTARTIDLVTAYVGDASILLLTSPGLQSTLIDWMDRYIFFADKVKLEDITEQTFAYTVLGPKADEIMTTLGASAIVGQPPHTHKNLALVGDLAGIDIQITVGTGLALPGYTLLGAKDQADACWQALQSLSAVTVDAATWEQLRIEQGRPKPGQELTDDDNPLEAGLWQTISFEKGCYIGQETIARLNTYDGVKKNLWGLKLSGPVEAGTPLTLEDKKVGKVTSVVETPDGFRGLGYVRTKAGGAGLTLQADNTSAEVIDVPFLDRPTV